MLDIGWSEMAMIALLALIVIGPKDLPTVMRTIGQYTRKARMMARDFQSSLDDMMHETELDEARKTVEKARTYNPKDEIEREVDPDGSVRETAAEFDREARAHGAAASGDQTAGSGPGTDRETTQGSASASASGGTAGTTSDTGDAAPAPASKNGASKNTGTKTVGTKTGGTKTGGGKSGGAKAAPSKAGSSKSTGDTPGKAGGKSPSKSTGTAKASGTSKAAGGSKSGGAKTSSNKAGGSKSNGAKSGGKSGGSKKADTTASS